MYPISVQVFIYIKTSSVQKLGKTVHIDAAEFSAQIIEQSVELLHTVGSVGVHYAYRQDTLKDDLCIRKHEFDQFD